MTWKEIVDLIIGIGTILAAIFAGYFALVAARSARETVTAVKLQREAIRAQTFIDILNSGTEKIGFSQCMDCVRSLKDGDCAELFRSSKKESQKKINKYAKL